MKRQVITILTVVVVGIFMFWVGVKWESRKIAAQYENQKSLFAQRPRDAKADNLANAGGEIVAKDDSSFMVKTKDGSLKKIMFSSGVSVKRTDLVDISNIGVGQQVSVNGKSNSDGTISAQSVAIRPDQNK